MRRAHEARLYALTTATACALALLAGVVGAPTRVVMQNLVFDQYQRWKPRPYAFDQPVRIVAIDDELLKRLGQWPWPRERLAALVDALKRAGAAAIAFDFLFSEKDRGDATAPADNTPDAAFARSMDDAAVVLGSFVSELPNGASGSVQGGIRHRRRRRDEVPDAIAGASGASARTGAACGRGRLPQLATGRRQGRATGAAHPQCEWRLAAESRHGGAARRAGRHDLFVKSSNASGETAFGEVYGVLAIRNGDLTIPTDASGDVRVYFARPDPRRSIPAWKALDPGADLSDLRGKIVFVGASAALLSDIVATPLSPRCRALKLTRRSSSSS